MRGFSTSISVLALALSTLASTASSTSDPCVIVAGKTFVPPKDALACLRSFPFNETLRQNVLTVISRVFDFYTFEDFYLNSPPPFQESTVNIRDELARINSTKYAVCNVNVLKYFPLTSTSSQYRNRLILISIRTCTTLQPSSMMAIQVSAYM